MNAIKQRQHYYRLGRDYEAEEDWEKALDAYKQYSSYLEEKDQHIPQFWIAKIYDKLGERNKAIYHLIKHAKGCSSSRQVVINQEIKERRKTMTRHPLKCPNCPDFRALVIKFVRFEKDSKGVDYNVPFYECKNCGNSEPLNTLEEWEEIAEKDREDLKEGEYVQMVFSYENKKFEQYDHLELKYDSTDYYLIPGLVREWDSGYLTPVFFDKDLLLHYNNHPDYSVRLYSFSSGNIYYKGEPLFRWGFGINRNGKIFKWLGDLNKDFSDDDMKPHLKRFQASNIDSDHDIYSKFYLSQIPYSPSEAFQESDNEYKIFHLHKKLDEILKNNYSINFSKLDINNLAEYYRQPILEENLQIFSSYSSLNKFLIENIQQDELKKNLRAKGLLKDELERLQSLKLFGKFMEHVLEIEDYNSIISPLFVLNDLRQLHSHLFETSFKTKYDSCKKRLNLDLHCSDFEVYQGLNNKLIEMYEKINIAASKQTN